MKSLFTFFLIINTIFVYSQDLPIAKELVLLAKFHQVNIDNGFVGEQAWKEFREPFKESPTRFISEISYVQTKGGTAILSNFFICRPDSLRLKYYYIFHCINEKLKHNKDIPLVEFANKLLEKDIKEYEQLQYYYLDIFSTTLPEKSSLDLSKYNWKLNQLGFQDKEEKAIFFASILTKPSFQLSQLYRNESVPNPSQIEALIKKLPQINGKAYFFFDDFAFDDFKIKYFGRNKSFKKTHLSRYFQFIMTYIAHLQAEQASSKQAKLIIRKSILQNKKLYRYCRNKKEMRRIIATAAAPKI